VEDIYDDSSAFESSIKLMSGTNIQHEACLETVYSASERERESTREKERERETA
jgi:hypothetical protein